MISRVGRQQRVPIRMPARLVQESEDLFELRCTDPGTDATMPTPLVSIVALT